VVYEVMLKKETFFTGNRVYLLATQLLVLMIPLLHFPVLQKKIPTQYQKSYTQNYYKLKETISETTTLSTPNEIVFRWEWIVYLGMFISLIVFVIKIFKIINIIRRGHQTKLNNRKIISTDIPYVAFSFLNYIIIGNHIPTSKQDEILVHEEIHVKQKHSFDLLIFEILRIVCWFNPFVYLYQKRITEVHEFIVDNNLSQSQIEKKQYFNSLLSEVFQTQKVSFTNSFYKTSLIKKRIQMLTKMKSKDRQCLKYFFIAPILGITISFAACNHNSKQLAVLMDNTSWHQTNYKNGDAIRAFQYIPQVEKNGSFMTIANKNKTRDAVVKIIENDTDTMYRDVYIKGNHEAEIKNLPIGRYYLKIAFGNDWQETCIENKCFGKFSKNETFQKRYFAHLLEFKITETIAGNRVNYISARIK